MGATGDRPEQRGARTRRWRADPDRGVGLRPRDRRARTLADRRGPGGPCARSSSRTSVSMRRWGDQGRSCSRCGATVTSRREWHRARAAGRRLDRGPPRWHRANDPGGDAGGDGNAFVTPIGGTPARVLGLMLSGGVALSEVPEDLVHVGCASTPPRPGSRARRTRSRSRAIARAGRRQASRQVPGVERVPRAGRVERLDRGSGAADEPFTMGREVRRRHRPS